MSKKEKIVSIINKYSLERVKSGFCGDKDILPYKEANEISKQFDIKTKKEWESLMMKYKFSSLPRRPDKKYKEWVSWSDWLGCISSSDRFYLSFENAKKITLLNNIKTKEDYMSNYKKINGLPSSPSSVYKDNWTDWAHFLSQTHLPKQEIKNNYLNYDNAKKIVNSWNIKSQMDWHSASSNGLIPENIPKTPSAFYKGNGWVSWNDWLGHSITPFKKILTYNKAKKFLEEINLSSFPEYYNYVIDNDIEFLSLNPYSYYKNENVSIYDYLSIDLSKWKVSFGEKKIIKHLEGNEIKYKHQFRFSDCVDKKCLIFDFYLPNREICIEFDGEQHFRPIEYFGGLAGYKDRIRKDIIKNEYCVHNDLKLIRISYKDINKVDEILKREISN